MFVFVGLGSNQGDRTANLRAGIMGFWRITGVNDIWQSPIYESAPMYVTDQPTFLNMVVGGAIAVDMEELLLRFKEMEADVGRDLSPQAMRNGPRPLDMDILLAYEGHWPPGTADVPIIHATQELTIPHPRMAERAFVLYPLRDLVPDLVHPTLHRTIAELAADVRGQDARRWVDEDLG